MTHNHHLAGRVALVTGASGGIGTAIARTLAGAGATVAVGYGTNAATAEALVAELGGGAAAFGANLEDPEAPEQLIAAAASAVGPVDVLIANHGLGRTATYDEVAAAFDRTLAINLRSPYLLAR